MEVQKQVAQPYVCGGCSQCAAGKFPCEPGTIPGLLEPEETQDTLPMNIPVVVPEMVQYSRVRTFVFENGEFLAKCQDENAAERVLNAMSAAAANDYNVRLLASLR